MKFYWKNYWKQDENLMGVYAFTDKATLIIFKAIQVNKSHLGRIESSILPKLRAEWNSFEPLSYWFILQKYNTFLAYK